MDAHQIMTCSYTQTHTLKQANSRTHNTVLM
jgi:hypothetical protein